MPPYIHMPSYAKSRDDEADRHITPLFRRARFER